MLFDILAWVLFGLIAGAVAQFLMPGRDPGQSADLKGFVITTLLGISGAIVGGYIGNALARAGAFGEAGATLQEARGLLDWRSLVTAVGGALIILLAYRALRMLGGIGAPATSSHGVRPAYSGYVAPSTTNLTEAVKN